MKLNKQTVTGTGVAWDGCHKIYIIEDEADQAEAEKIGYTIYSIQELPRVWTMSCPLRFIKNWKLNKVYVEQDESATFEEG